MSTEFRGRFPHSTGPAVDGSVYDRYTGRWSQLFAPLVLEAAAVERGPPARCLRRTREAARMALPIVGAAGCVMGVDISPAMLGSARARLRLALFWPVAADGQALPFGDASVDAVVYQLGLQFCPEPARGLGECRRVLRRGGRVAVCVISHRDWAPMGVILPMSSAASFPNDATPCVSRSRCTTRTGSEA